MIDIGEKTSFPSKHKISLARYRLIEAVLREQIMSGEYGPGDQLPPEAELSTIFSASRPTVRQALAGLESEGLIKKEHGRGTFVKGGSLGKTPKRFEILLDELVELPEPAKITIQRTGMIKGYSFAHEMLKLPRGEEIFYFVRVYHVDKQPIGANKVHVPAAIGGRLCADDLSKRNIPKMVARCADVKLGSYALSVDSELAEPRYAVQVGIRAGAALTSIRRTSYDTNGTPIEHTQILLRPDMCHLVAHRNFIQE